MTNRKSESKPHKLGDILVLLLLCVFVGGIAFSAWKLLSINRESETGIDTYTELAQMAVVKQEQTKPAEKQEETAPVLIDEKEPKPSHEASVQEQEPIVEIDFEALQSVNAQIVAWIRSDDGQIDYPVVHGSDNRYYLNHLVDGTENKNGSIFIDWRNPGDFSYWNTFVYGHNMNNGSMFAPILQYSTAGYYEAHRQLRLFTPEAQYALEVFSGYTLASNSDSYQIHYDTEAEYAEYLERIQARSEFSTDVSVSVQDRIVTLSTCAYVFDNARYVLHCRLIRLDA